jgi:hypothetical protein
VAVGGMSPGAQCITLPALDPDAACGDDGRRELGFAVVGGAPGLSSGPRVTLNWRVRFGPCGSRSWSHRDEFCRDAESYGETKEDTVSNPTVTEITRRPEAVAHDTFIDDLRTAPASAPNASSPRCSS